MIEVLPPDHPSPGQIEKAAWKIARWFSHRRDQKWLRMHDADLRVWNRTALDPSAHRLMRCPNLRDQGQYGRNLYRLRGVADMKGAHLQYATIVADPPWHYGRKFNAFSSTRNKVKGPLSDGPRDLPYATMSIEEIMAIPVGNLATEAAHLYLWVTHKHLWSAPDVVRAWGFKPGVLLTWCKQPMGVGLGDAFTPTSEFVLFAHRGGLRPLGRHESTWFTGKRAKHSQKPEVFLDIVERVSPGPYLELFARRNRLGWDTWGNEAMNHVEMPA